MITPIDTPWEPELWHGELRNALRSSGALLEYVGLPPPGDEVDPAERDFPVLVPRGFADRITPGDADDPILRQVLYNREERRNVAGFTADPLGETRPQVIASPSLIHKYAGRALLIATSGCAVHCRYCFRRHFPYSEHGPSARTEAIAAIRTDEGLSEVILSGGDPLLLEDAALNELLHTLGNIPHIRRIRIHTRMPIVLPERVTAALLAALASTPVPVVMVVHCNHAAELNSATARALGALDRSVQWLLNQAVMLKGVNNTLTAQTALAEALFDQHVQPYYLHMPDRVAGTHHFFIDDQQARLIYADMQASLPGYLVPKLVREEAGAAGKTMLVF